jgi:hypothetical protein
MATAEQIRDLELIFDMTSHPGWKCLVKDMQERIDALKEGLVSNESSPYQLGLAQGHVKVYREIVALRDMLDHFLSEKAIEALEDVQAAAV